MLEPRESWALFLDSGSNEKTKEYHHIKAVLNDALNGYAHRQGFFKKKNVRRGKHQFFHREEFACIKQAPGGAREAWYLIHHMREYVKDCQKLQFPSARDKWCKLMSEATDSEIRQEFGRIQQTIARIIWKDVLDRDGVFFAGRAPPPNDEILDRVVMQGDHRPFNSLDGCRPFPPLPKEKPSKK